MQITIELEDQLREVNRSYQGFVSAQTKLSNQRFGMVKRIACEGGASAENPPKKDMEAAEEKLANSNNLLYTELQLASAAMDPGRDELKKALEKLAMQLPHYDFVKSKMKGLGAATYAQIIGETGDLTKYANPSKVWKRLGVAVINGERQRKVKDKELAILMGYSPRRHSLLYIMTTGLMRMNGEDGKYRKVYDKEKVRQFERLNTDENIAKMKKKSVSGKYSPKAHAHNRAMRYMGKRVIRDLWNLWHGFEVKV